jgi:hypothetical protein
VSVPSPVWWLPQDLAALHSTKDEVAAPPTRVAAAMAWTFAVDFADVAVAVLGEEDHRNGTLSVFPAWETDDPSYTVY